MAAAFAPSVVKRTKIFDIDERKFNETGLHFRHTDNINYFLTAAKVVGLPKVKKVLPISYLIILRPYVLQLNKLLA